jgi:hypothetical protein
MNPRISITGAERKSASGPSARFWQVSFTAEMDQKPPYHGLVCVALPEGQGNFHGISESTPKDIPEWANADDLRERAHWYIFNQVRDALEPSDGSKPALLRVDTVLVEEWVDGTWRVVN